ncbi:MAG: DUF308 domain-containing protein [Lachnospiraceae bacterium]|nr:DUF308 domain-containing protein [Lachnospiraceae bacterium]
MQTLLKEIKADILLSAVVCVVIGIVVMIWPEKTTLLLCRALALVLLVMGAASAFTYLADREAGRFGLASGIVVFALGALIMIRPSLVARMIPIVVGIIFVMHGMEDMQLAMEGKSYGDKSWWISSLFSSATIVLGILLIWKSFSVAMGVTWFLGLMLVFDGVSDLIIVAKVNHAVKTARMEAEAIDVEFEERD